MNSNNNDANVSDKRRHKKLKIDVINPKYKSNLNKDNDKSVDNNKNNNNNKKSVFIVEESIVKNLNCFLIMKENNHKYIVTAWSFSSTKLYCT